MGAPWVFALYLALLERLVFVRGDYRGFAMRGHVSLALGAASSEHGAQRQNHACNGARHCDYQHWTPFMQHFIPASVPGQGTSKWIYNAYLMLDRKGR